MISKWTVIADFFVQVKSRTTRNKRYKKYNNNHYLLLFFGGYIAINPKKFDKLITSLRTAVEHNNGILDKEATSYDDIFDAFRLANKILRLTKHNFFVYNKYVIS
jgi:hypothetical protein